MKAIAWTNYGPPEVLQLQEIAKPTPKANEVLIKVYASTVTAGDCEMRSLKLPLLIRLPMRLYMGFNQPKGKILGQELAGEVESVGSAVTRFKPGDQVCAVAQLGAGAYAEYTCLPENHPIALKPVNMSYAEAATIPTGGLNALHFLRKANLQAGERLLIDGAGGSIGTYALQIAKSMGAEVTCVDSTPKLPMLRSIGANHVIDYTQTNFTKTGERYDAIIDVVGKSSFVGSVNCLKQNGRYILGNPTLGGMIGGLWVSKTTTKRVIPTVADGKAEDLLFLKELIEAGKLKAVIDQVYRLADIVEAHRYVENGHKKGNVVITVA